MFFDLRLLGLDSVDLLLNLGLFVAMTAKLFDQLALLVQQNGEGFAALYRAAVFASLQKDSSLLIHLLDSVSTFFDLLIIPSHLSKMLILLRLLGIGLQLRNFRFVRDFLIFVFGPLSIVVLIEIAILIILGLFLLLPGRLRISPLILPAAVSASATSLVVTLLWIEFLVVSLMIHTY